VTNGIILAIIFHMARPRKDKGERKSVDLRIPLTESQKALVAEAARAGGIDMATWARPILLQAAREQVARSDESKQAK
jgi:hypothetical protein